jgi:4-hydroxybenzoyl-CoA thioesterase
MVTNRRRLRVTWGDCDPAGIVFYPNYFAWFDDCTFDLFESVGLPPRRLFADFGVKGFPLLEAGAKFHVASSAGDEMEAETAITEWGDKIFKLAHRFTRDGALLLEGNETRIFVIAHPDDPTRLKSVPIPDGIRVRFSD